MLRNLTPIFDLGDRGVIQLPAEIGRIRAVLAALDNVELPETPHPSLLADQLVDQTVQAAESGNLDAVDYHAPIAAETAARVAQYRADAVTAARIRVEEQITRAVRHHAETIVKALQPVFIRTIADYTRALVVAQQWPDPAQALTASTKVRTALSARRTLRETIDTIATARAVLWNDGYRCEVDELGEFAMASDGHQLWPRTTRQMNPRAPWEGTDKLDYFVTRGASVWLPTVPEQAQAHDAAYGDAIREQQNRVRGARATAAMMAGGDRLPTYSSGVDQPSTPTPSTSDRVRHQLFGGSGADDNEVTVTTDTMGRLIVTP